MEEEKKKIWLEAEEQVNFQSILKQLMLVAKTEDMVEEEEVEDIIASLLTEEATLQWSMKTWYR